MQIVVEERLMLKRSRAVRVNRRVRGGGGKSLEGGVDARRVLESWFALDRGGGHGGDGSVVAERGCGYWAWAGI